MTERATLRNADGAFFNWDAIQIRWTEQVDPPAFLIRVPSQKLITPRLVRMLAPEVARDNFVAHDLPAPHTFELQPGLWPDGHTSSRGTLVLTYTGLEFTRGSVEQFRAAIENFVGAAAGETDARAKSDLAVVNDWLRSLKGAQPVQLAAIHSL